MRNFRKAISKFKADFEDESGALPIPAALASSLRSNRSSRTISDDASRDDRTSSSINHDLTTVPSIDDSNEDEVVSPLQQRSLFQSLRNPSHVSSNASSPSVSSDSSSRLQSDPPNLTSINKEFAKVSALVISPPTTTKKKKDRTSTTSSHDSSVPSIDVLPPATHSVSPKNPFMIINTRSDSRPEAFEKVSALVSQKIKQINVTHEPLEEVDSPVDLPSDPFSRTTNGVPITHDEPMSIWPSSSNSLTHEESTPTSQPEDSISRTISPRVVNGNDSNDQHIQPPSLPSKLEREFAPNSVVSEINVPGDFPLDEVPTPPTPPMKPATKTFPDMSAPKSNNSAKPRRRPSDTSFLIALATTPEANSTEVQDKVEQPKARLKATSRPLHRLNESSDDGPLTPEDILARKMEELGRLRRMESRNLPRASPEVTSQRSQFNRPTVSEIRPQLQTLQEDDSADVEKMLREAYAERQQTLQTQLDKALAELGDLRAENKRLTTENESQQRSIKQLKSSLDEVKHTHDHSLVQIKNQLDDATSSLDVVNKEKKGWQDKLDSMQHKLNVAERQVRCLDHLTRYKLESRQETAYGPPKRRGQQISTQASTDIIGAMRALNEEIYQTCVQFVEGLERTTVSTIKHKSQVQKVLGYHLTTMMEDQTKKSTSGYNLLLMQTVLEVFMTHWCSSIIEAFYPRQESFADLLVELSAQTARTPGSIALCGKQIKIVESSVIDNVKFNDWVKDIIKELGLFLTLGGLRMKTQRAVLFSTKTLALVKLAYDLRTAMAEKDISGGLEVVVVPPDTPFQEKSMMDAHAHPRRGATDHSHIDLIAGTSGIGLQRKVLDRVGGQLQSRMEVELKPRVVLVRALN